MFEQPSIIKETSAGFSSVSLESDMLSNREIVCVGEINANSVNSVIKQLLYLQKQEPNKKITLYINSPGGEVDSGMALYDVMQAIKCPIETVCVGIASSMAALIFISGSERGMLPHSRLMIHDPRILQTGGSALNLKAVSDDLIETRNIMAALIAKHSGRTVDEILEKTARDSYFRAEEAIGFGLADKIITKLWKGKGNEQ